MVTDSRNRWNPAQYMKGAMGDLRTRPAVDLLNRVNHDNPRRVVDLGCGPGNSTMLLRGRWTDAAVTGIDNAPAMIEKASSSDTDIDWQLADIGDWQPAEPVDVIFANASLHWVPDHAGLFIRLADALAEGGVLAVQMPNNFASSSHALIGEIAERSEFRALLAGKLLGDHVQPPTFYHDLMRGLDGTVDVWETEYLQSLTGEDPVLEWVRGTALLPVQQNLTADDFATFTALYRDALKRAYPVATDGVTVFPFRRMFITFKGR
ncbi:MAG: methyltransferase domain-containing protein [Minwuia sp.]|nr:methyltransferase domain-containing protein [Minwuia sp.]